MEKVLISKLQFIRNAKLPVCLDCVYFVQGLKRCSKFGDKDVVSGKISYVNAESARSIENMCSRKGIYFENK
jgi:hypothetical protein